MADLERALRADGHATAWLSLDASDDDFGQLVRCLVGAVRARHPGFGENVTVLLQGGVGIGDESIVRLLANELSALPDPLAFFLEDAHELCDTLLSGVIRSLVTGTSPHVQFVISSRREIALGVGRLRATGLLAEIGWEELCFTAVEVREYFARANQLALAPDLVAKVLARTEGWAAALQLASLALGPRRSLAALLDRFEGDERGIAAYLADDVLRHLAPDVRDFLLQIGPLGSVCTPLCIAATGRDDAAALLARIQSANIFLFASDSAPGWYRFHPLLAEFLRRRLARTSPGALREVHTRASDWFAAAHGYDSAVEHALLAGDLERAAGLLDTHAYDLWRRGHQSRLDGWAREIPAAQRRRFPRLRLVQAWSLMLAGRLSAAIAILDDVAGQLRAASDELVSAMPACRDPSLPGQVLFMRVMVAFYREEIELAESLCERWLLDPAATDPFLVGAVKSVLAGVRGLMYEPAYARREASSIADLLEESGTTYGPIWSYSILGAVCLGIGLLSDAIAALERAMTFAERTGGPDTPLAAMPATILALARYERDELAAADELIARFAHAAERVNFADFQISAFVVPARLLAARGEPVAALALLDAAQRTLGADPQRPARIHAHLLHEKLRLLTRERHASELRDLLRDPVLTRPISDYLPTRVGGAHAAIRAQARIRASLARAEPEIGLALARRWIAYLQVRRLPRPEVAFRLLAARAAIEMGQESAALRDLRSALRVAAPQALTRPFLDEDPPLIARVAHACVALGETGPDHRSFFAGLAASLAAAPAHARLVVGDEGAPPRRLGRRELEVLQMVARGCSNREIGETLGLTENTVKWNLRQSFQKLAVKRRVQAISRARELGLID
ncbi:MAG: LuxR C-terminal-related transcriptional regulator [Gammaproteobacteria bacterium]